MSITVEKGKEPGRSSLIKQLVNARYERNDTELVPGRFRIKGDTIDIIPAYSDDVVRISMFGDMVEKISVCDPISLKEKKIIPQIKIFTAKHYLVTSDERKTAIESINNELKKTIQQLREIKRQ